MVVNGNLALDGRISANGGTAVGLASGGGSGGSLWLRGGKLTGSGTISANGGAGDLPYGGGGGGGRIAVAYNTNQFTGVLSAHGGAGAFFGSAGTVCILSSPNIINGQLIVDNGGSTAATNTVISNLQGLDLTVSD